MSSLVLLAQAGGAEEALPKLVNYGVLGIFCVLLITALVWTVKSWKGAMEARTQDAMGYASAMKALNDALHTHAIETVKAVQSANAKLKELGDQHGEIRKVLDDHVSDSRKRCEDHAVDMRKQHEGLEKSNKDSQDIVRRDVEEVRRLLK